MFDSTFVGASENSEKAVLTPVSGPRVGNQPIWNATVDAPTEDLDGVTSYDPTILVLVNSGSIIIEVLIDGVSSFNWAVGPIF